MLWIEILVTMIASWLLVASFFKGFFLIWRILFFIASAIIAVIGFTIGISAFIAMASQLLGG